MPIHSILTLRTIASIVRHHCLIQPSTKELRRLQERRFRPKEFSKEVHKLALIEEPQSYDDLEKVVRLTKFYKPIVPASRKKSK